MTIADITTFLEIVKQGTISGAAQALYISQPAITRRMRLMEEELGYALIERKKGKRAVRLTGEGAAFYQIAWKWQELLEETAVISDMARRELLSVASVHSVSHGLLKGIFSDYVDNGVRMRLYNVFSEDAYQYMAQGLYDLAFIEQQEYNSRIPPNVEMKPVFREEYVLVTAKDSPSMADEAVDLQRLDGEKELLVPWNNSYKTWHNSFFKNRSQPPVVLEDLSLAENFLVKERWIIIPYTMGLILQKKGMFMSPILNPPPARVIYYLHRINEDNPLVNRFLKDLNALLLQMPGEKIQSFLEQI